MLLTKHNYLLKMKNVVNEGYEIRNLGNPPNDPDYSVFFDIEEKSVPW